MSLLRIYACVRVYKDATWSSILLGPDGGVHGEWTLDRRMSFADACWGGLIPPPPSSGLYVWEGRCLDEIDDVWEGAWRPFTDDEEAVYAAGYKPAHCMPWLRPAGLEA